MEFSRIKNKHTKDAYVLSITIIVTFVLVLTIVTLLSLVYRYSNSSTKDLEALRDIVKNYCIVRK